MPDKKFEKLVAVEALNLFTGANEEFAKRAKEYVFYDDVPSSEEEVIRRAKDADGILVNLSTQITAGSVYLSFTQGAMERTQMPKAPIKINAS